MNFFFKKNYLIVLCLIFIFLDSEANSKSKNAHYSKEDISNYFIGIVSANQDYTGTAFEHLNNVEFLKNKHNNFKVEYIRTLVLLEKFDQAFSFSKSIWSADEFFFEADIILGLNYFINKDYSLAEKHFERLNIISEYNIGTKVNIEVDLIARYLERLVLSEDKEERQDIKEEIEIAAKALKGANTIKTL